MSYAVLRATDLDWIVRPGYSSGGYILGCSQHLSLSGTQLGLDLTCFVIVIRHLPSVIRIQNDSLYHYILVTDRPCH